MQGPLPTDAATMHRKPPVNIHRLVTAIYFCGGWAGECHSEDNLQELIFSFPLWGLRLREDAFSCGLSLCPHSYKSCASLLSWNPQLWLQKWSQAWAKVRMTAFNED